MYITKLQQTIATSQHIWLLTSELIMKTANSLSQHIEQSNTKYVNTAYSVSYRNAVLFIQQKADV